MPIEATLLKDQEYPEITCPKCGAFPVKPFMRGMVQRKPRSRFRPIWAVRYRMDKYGWGWYKALLDILEIGPNAMYKPRAYCAIICEKCKEVIGFERPDMTDHQIDSAQKELDCKATGSVINIGRRRSTVNQDPYRSSVSMAGRYTSASTATGWSPPDYTSSSFVAEQPKEIPVSLKPGEED